jgi:hypothetical protein
MSDLENAVKPILTPPDRHSTAYNHSRGHGVLGQWIPLKIMLGERNYPGEAMTPQEDRSAFRSTLEIRPNFRIWIAKCDERGWQTGYLRHAATIGRSPIVMPHHKLKNIHRICARIVPRTESAGRIPSKGENYVADRRLPGFWHEDRHLSFFLAFLVLMTIVVPMVGESRRGRIAIDLTFALMLLSGAIATVEKRVLMSLIIALTILEFTADLFVEFDPAFSLRGWDTALKVLCMAILVVMTLKQTFLLPGPVSVHRVMGGIAAYLLIGVTWAFGYKLLLEMIPEAIHFQTPLEAKIATGEPGRLIYFSFETLTTVSYGDAYPVHRIARSLTTAEALIGQLYPAILIATLVGMALQARFKAVVKEAEVEKPT